MQRNHTEEPFRGTMQRNHSEEPCRGTMQRNRAEEPCRGTMQRNALCAYSKHMRHTRTREVHTPIVWTARASAHIHIFRRTWGLRTRAQTALTRAHGAQRPNTHILHTNHLDTRTATKCTKAHTTKLSTEAKDKCKECIPSITDHKLHAQYASYTI